MLSSSSSLYLKIISEVEGGHHVESDESELIDLGEKTLGVAGGSIVKRGQ